MNKQETALAYKTCTPCSAGVPPLRGESIARLHNQLQNDWQVIEEHHLQKSFSFPDFKSALTFVNSLGGIAEREGHHPNIDLEYGKVTLRIWTHKIRGLSESDFIFAAKADLAFEEWQASKVP